MTDIIQEEIKANYQVGNIELNSDIFRDFALNDKIASKFLYVDEHVLVKKKKNIYVHFKFNEYTTETIAASITQDIVQHSNARLINKGVKIGEPFLSIKIVKVKNESIANNFIYIFGKILSYYALRYNKILKVYKDILGEDDFKVEKYVPPKKIITEDESTLHKLYPNVFDAEYSKRCPPERHPRLITKDEAKEIKDKWGDVLDFPKDEKYWDKHYFTCISGNAEEKKSKKKSKKKHDKYPQLSFVENKSFKTKDKFSHLPCCFADIVDAENNKKAYFEGEVKQKGKKASYFIQTNKHLANGQEGVLPRNIQKLFDLFDLEQDGNYIRIGAEKSPFSIIYSLFRATKKKIVIADVKEIRNKILIDHLGHFKSYQMFYKYKPETIDEIVRNENTFIDARLFIKELEDIFNVNILIFSRNNTFDGGFITSPFFTHYYYDLQSKDRDYVFIYQHMGTELGGLEYPQCEIIIKKYDVTNVHYKFSGNIVDKLINVYRELYIEDNLDHISLEFKSAQIIGQGIDPYGKTRYLQLDNKICVYTSPLPNFPVPLTYNYEPVSIKKCKKFLENENIVLQKGDNIVNTFSYRIIDNYIVGIDVNFRTNEQSPIIQLFIPTTIKHSSEEKWLIESKNYALVNSNNILPYNIMQKYNTYLQLSRYMSEYALYLFSTYNYENIKNNMLTLQQLLSNLKLSPKYSKLFIKQNILVPSDLPNKNLSEIMKNPEDEEKLSNFLNKTNFNVREIVHDFGKNIKVIQNHEYKYIPRGFSLEDSSIIQKGKLIVDDKMTKLKLLYLVEKYMNTNQTELLSYRDKLYIDNYYENIDDFIRSPYQLILRGDNTLKRWTTDVSIDYDIVDVLKIVDLQVPKVKKLANEIIDEDRKKKDYEIIIQNRHLNMIPYIFHNVNLTRLLRELKENAMEYYIVQPVSSIREGIYISNNWNKDGINIGSDTTLKNIDDINDTKILDCVIAHYVDSSDIQIVREDDNYSYIILFYNVPNRKDVITLYNVLLPLVH
jgi:hypothetical protein